MQASGRTDSRDLRRRLPAALVRVAIQVIAKLPLDASIALVASIASLYARLGGPRIDDARINLEIAFPEWSPQRRHEVLTLSLANLGRGLAETCHLHGRARAQLLERVEIEGLEHLEAAQRSSESGGVLVVAAHFGSWELCAAAIAHRGVPVSVVQHERQNPYLERIVTGWRQDAGLETLKLGRAGLSLMRALRRGRVVALLMDQNARRNEGVFAPFFSLDACTRAGPIRVAMKQGTPILPIFFFREGMRHVARFGSALEIEPSSDASDAALIRNVARMNASIEAAIRSAPDHWIWSHRRWKTRPQDDPTSPYPKRRSLLRSLRHRLR
jgi:KDO2-lipid IV(A) lauroyltransferase